LVFLSGAFQAFVRFFDFAGSIKISKRTQKGSFTLFLAPLTIFNI